MQFAVIDCGTNVFNLLIAEITDDRLKISAVHKISVQLFKGSQTRTIYLKRDKFVDLMHSIHS